MKPKWLEEALSWKGFVYCCTPYSLYPAGQEAAFIAAAQYAAFMLAEGLCVYSPIAHSHTLATYSNLDPLDHRIWMRNDRAMIDAAAGAVVIMMNGWQESRGIAEEVTAFVAAGKPVVYASVADLSCLTY